MFRQPGRAQSIIFSRCAELCTRTNPLIHSKPRARASAGLWVALPAALRRPIERAARALPLRVRGPISGPHLRHPAPRHSGVLDGSIVGRGRPCCCCCCYYYSESHKSIMESGSSLQLRSHFSCSEDPESYRRSSLSSLRCARSHTGNQYVDLMRSAGRGPMPQPFSFTGLEKILRHNHCGC